MDSTTYALRLQLLSKGLVAFAQQVGLSYYDDTQRDSAIKRFEYSFELVWKCLKEGMAYDGLEPTRTPRETFKQAVRYGYINQEPLAGSIAKPQPYQPHLPRRACSASIGEATRLFNHF